MLSLLWQLAQVIADATVQERRRATVKFSEQAESGNWTRQEQHWQRQCGGRHACQELLSSVDLPRPNRRRVALPHALHRGPFECPTRQLSHPAGFASHYNPRTLCTQYICTEDSSVTDGRRGTAPGMGSCASTANHSESIEFSCGNSVQ